VMSKEKKDSRATDGWWRLGAAESTAPMSREEEIAVARLARKGDLSARNRLVSSNVRLAIQITGEYRKKSSADFDDLVQEGMLGLLQAVERFDPERGVRFMSYAVMWVRSAVTRAMGERIADGDHVSLDLDEYGEGPAPRMASSDPIADEAYESVEIAEILARLIEGASLAPRERMLVYARLYTAEPKSLAEVGGDLSISRERVLQLEVGLKRRLRSLLAPFFEAKA
jgi:RNA polymerase sigma factor (sigma-70 family)